MNVQSHSNGGLSSRDASKDENAAQRSTVALRAKMAALQQELEAQIAREDEQERTSLKAAVLMPKSPSPRKRKAAEVFVQPASKRFAKQSKDGRPIDLLTEQREQKPSTFNSNMSLSRRDLISAEARRQLPKATGFSGPANSLKSAKRERESDDDEEDIKPAFFKDRDEDLALIENLEPGPLEFNAPIEDPLFDKVEPYSKIRLKSRLLSHERFQDHMAARYYVSPSLLYSIVRPGRGTDLEVPIDGDWILIGVLAEKSRIMFTAGPKVPDKKSKKKKKADGDLPPDAKDDTELGDSGEEDALPSENEDDADPRRPSKSKRFLFFKLLDMRLRRGSSVTAGDSYLSVALFEADSSTVLYEAASSDEEVVETGARVQKQHAPKGQRKKETYKGGSGGAYEKFWKETEGTVVAIMNPKVMKQRQNPNQPWSNTLTVTPESADSIIILGQSQDLTKCRALTKAGVICGSACDSRVNDHCEYHVQNAVQRARSGRSELMTGTSAMTQNVGRQKKKVWAGGSSQAPYDPSRKLGLLPNTNKTQVDGLSTYVTAGSGARPGRRLLGAPTRALPSESASSTRGRETLAEKKKRQESADRVLQKVLKRDEGKSVGLRYLHSAKAVAIQPQDDEEERGDDEIDGGKARQKRVFGAGAIKALGFDPSRKEALLRDEDEVSKSRKLECFAALDPAKDRPEPKLGAAPNKRMSGVAVPSDEEDDLVIVKDKPRVKRKPVNVNPRSQYPSNEFNGQSQFKQNSNVPYSKPFKKPATATQSTQPNDSAPPKAKQTNKQKTNQKTNHGGTNFKSAVDDSGGAALSNLMANFRSAASKR